MLATLLLALPLSAPAQAVSLPRPPAPDEAEGWRLVDGVAQIVNGDMITWAAVARELDARRKEVEINTREDEIALQREVLSELVERALWAQAGRELGIGTEEVEYSVDRMIESREERIGRRSRAASLAERSMTLQDEREEVRNELFRGAWRDAIVGRQPGSVGRVTRDGYLRPGELYGFYRKNPELLAEPEQVRLQVLAVLGDAVGGLDAAREHAEGLRAEALAGADLDRLVDENGALFRENHGRLEPLIAARLTNADWRRFATEATATGELSPVLEFREKGQHQGYLFLKLCERIPGAPPPPFTAAEVQRRIGRFVQARAEDETLGRAHEQLVRSSYFWPGSDSRRPAR